MKAQLFDISHVTQYGYRTPVTVAHHLLRLTPRQMPRQQCLQHEISLDPLPPTRTGRTDYFGNAVTFVSLAGTHQHFTVRARSRVAVAPPFIPEPSETPAWDRVRARCQSDRSPPVLDALEFAFASPLVPVGADFADYAAPCFPHNRPTLEAVLELCGRIHADFQFDPTATTVSTPLDQVLSHRRGVCQDFAHLMIACLRSLGLPARYVSGYLETLPPPGQAKLIGVDASHAWVAFFCPGLGWTDIDPTNNLLPSLQHITLGWGRDFSDVSPIRGVLLGGEGHDLQVAVDVVAQGETELA